MASRAMFKGLPSVEDDDQKMDMNELLGLAKPSTGNRRSTAVAELILKDRKEDYENLQPLEMIMKNRQPPPIKEKERSSFTDTDESTKDDEDSEIIPPEFIVKTSEGHLLVPFYVFDKMRIEMDRAYEELLRDHESETIVWKKRFEQTRKSKQLSDKTNLEVQDKQKQTIYEISEKAAQTQRSSVMTSLDLERMEEEFTWLRSDYQNIQMQHGEAQNKFLEVQQSLLAARIQATGFLEAKQDEVAETYAAFRADAELCRRATVDTAESQERRWQEEARREDAQIDGERSVLRSRDDLARLERRAAELRSAFAAVEGEQEAAVQLRATVRNRVQQAEAELGKMQAQHEARLAERKEFFGQSMASSDAMERLMRYERSLTIAEMKEMREVLANRATQWEKDQAFLSKQAASYREKIAHLTGLSDGFAGATEKDFQELSAMYARWGDEDRARTAEVRGMVERERQKNEQLMEQQHNSVDFELRRQTEKEVKDAKRAMGRAWLNFEEELSVINADEEELSRVEGVVQEQAAQDRTERFRGETALVLLESDGKYDNLKENAEKNSTLQVIEKLKLLLTVRRNYMDEIQTLIDDQERELERVVRLTQGALSEVAKATGRAEDAEKETDHEREIKADREDELQCLRRGEVGEMAAYVQSLQSRLREASEQGGAQHGQLGQLRGRANAAERERDALRGEVNKAKARVEALRAGELAESKRRFQAALDSRDNAVELLQQRTEELATLRQQLVDKSAKGELASNAPMSLALGALGIKKEEHQPKSKLWSLMKKQKDEKAFLRMPKLEADKNKETTLKGLKHQLEQVNKEVESLKRDLWKQVKLMEDQKEEWRQERVAIYSEAEEKSEQKWNADYEKLKATNVTADRNLVEKKRHYNELLANHKAKMQALERERDEVKTERDELHTQVSHMKDNVYPKLFEEYRALEAKVAAGHTHSQGEVYKLLGRLEEMEEMEKKRDSAIGEAKAMTKKNVQLSKDIEEVRRLAGKRAKEMRQEHVSLQKDLEEMDKEKMDAIAERDGTRQHKDRISVKLQDAERTSAQARTDTKVAEVQLDEELILRRNVDGDWRAKVEETKKAFFQAQQDTFTTEEAGQIGLSRSEEAEEIMIKEFDSKKSVKDIQEEEQQVVIGRRVNRNVELNTKLRRLEHRLHQVASEMELAEVACQSKIDDEAKDRARMAKRSNAQIDFLKRERDDLRKKLSKYAMFAKKYELTCGNCGQTYKDSDNFAWSCRHHRQDSFEASHMWFCCGETVRDAPGCVFSKHVPALETMTEKIREEAGEEVYTGPCQACGIFGHQVDECPQDPNMRTKKMGLSELDRLESLGQLEVSAHMGVTEKVAQQTGGDFTTEEDRDQPLTKQPWLSQGGHEGLLKEKQKKQKAIVELARTQVSQAMLRDDPDKLNDAIENLRKLKIAPDLAERAERRYLELQAILKLQSILNRIDVLIFDWKLDGDITLTEAYLTELKSVINLTTKKGEATSGDAESQKQMFLADANKKMGVLNGLIDLHRAINSQHVENIQKSIVLCERYEVDAVTLEEARQQCRRITAQLNLEMASLEEQRADGTDESTLIMVFTDAMIERLRNSIEEAVMEEVSKDKIDRAREMLAKVDLRCELQEAINGTDSSRLRSALGKAMEMKLPRDLINKGNNKRLQLTLIDRMGTACAEKDLERLDHVLKEAVQQNIIATLSKAKAEAVDHHILENFRAERDKLAAEREIIELQNVSHAEMDLNGHLAQLSEVVGIAEEIKAGDDAIRQDAQQMINQLECVKNLHAASLEDGYEEDWKKGGRWHGLLADAVALKVEAILVQRHEVDLAARVLEFHFEEASEINSLQTALQQYKNLEESRGDAPPLLSEEVIGVAAGRLQDMRMMRRMQDIMSSDGVQRDTVLYEKLSEVVSQIQIKRGDLGLDIPELQEAVLMLRGLRALATLVDSDVSIHDRETMSTMRYNEIQNQLQSDIKKANEILEEARTMAEEKAEKKKAEEQSEECPSPRSAEEPTGEVRPRRSIWVAEEAPESERPSLARRPSQQLNWDAHEAQTSPDPPSSEENEAQGDRGSEENDAQGDLASEENDATADPPEENDATADPPEESQVALADKSHAETEKSEKDSAKGASNMWKIMRTKTKMMVTAAVSNLGPKWIRRLQLTVELLETFHTAKTDELQDLLDEARLRGVGTNLLSKVERRVHQLRAEDTLVDLARTEGIAVELEAKNLAKLKESLQSAEVDGVRPETIVAAQEAVVRLQATVTLRAALEEAWHCQPTSQEAENLQKELEAEEELVLDRALLAEARRCLRVLRARHEVELAETACDLRRFAAAVKEADEAGAPDEMVQSARSRLQSLKSDFRPAARSSLTAHLDAVEADRPVEGGKSRLPPSNQDVWDAYDYAVECELSEHMLAQFRERLLALVGEREPKAPSGPRIFSRPSSFAEAREPGEGEAEAREPGDEAEAEVDGADDDMDGVDMELMRSRIQAHHTLQAHQATEVLDGSDLQHSLTAVEEDEADEDA